MHGLVRDELEHLLAAKPSAVAGNFDHTAGCKKCAAEVDAMRLQAESVRRLRAPQAMEPGAGFYARVMEHIEQSARRSIWWVFVYSPVGKRLAYASLAVSLALGSYVLAAESKDGDLGGRSESVSSPAAAPEHFDPMVTGSPDDQRSAVLSNFVSHPVARQISTIE